MRLIPRSFRICAPTPYVRNTPPPAERSGVIAGEVVAAVEVLVNTGRVFDRLVDPDQTDSIVDVIAEGGFYGMQSFDQALVSLVKDGQITTDEARRTASSPHDFDLQLSGVLDRGSAFSDDQKSGLPF